METGETRAGIRRWGYGGVGVSQSINGDASSRRFFLSNPCKRGVERQGTGQDPFSNQTSSLHPCCKSTQALGLSPGIKVRVQ